MTERECRAWIAAPVSPRGESRLLGVLLVLLDASSLEKMLTHPEGLGTSGAVVVVRRDGDKIYNLLTPGMPGLDAQLAPASAGATLGHEGFVETHDRNGVPVLAAYRPVGL